MKRRRWRLWMPVMLLLAMTGLVAPHVAHAEIFLQEDFDDGNLPARGWYDIARWGVEFFISTTERFSGNASLEVRYQTGSTGSWMRHQFSGTDRIYTRYYRKWAPDWEWPDHGSGPHDTYIFGMYGQPQFSPTSTYVTIYTDSIYMGPPAWRYAAPGLGTKRDLQGESYRHPSAISPPPPGFQLNRWYCIETMAAMNTPGAADGRLQLWVDGALLFDMSGVTLRDTANAALQFDSFMFGPYYHIGAPKVQSTWIDALVVADTRVGCLSDSVPPAAPTGLQVRP